MALASVSQLKEYLGVSGVADDVLLDRVLEGAEAFLLMCMNRKTLDVTSFSQTLDGTGKDYVQVSYWPLISVTSLIVGGEAVAPSKFVFGEQGTFDSRAIYLTSGDLFPRGRRNVVVTGTAGYTTPPPEVVQAVLETAGRGYQKRKRLDETSKQVGGETISYSTKDLTDFARQTVNNHTNRIPL